MQKATSPKPRPASTVVVVRDHPGGLQTLLLRRNVRSGFAASMWVFPGGAVDEGDRTLPAQQWSGIDVEQLATRFEIPAERVLAHHVGAVRETFEESGLLIGLAPDALSLQVLADVRAACAADGTGAMFAQSLAAQKVRLDLGQLVYFSRWVTPEWQPKRYDTWFFIAAVADSQAATHDGVELTESEWVRPADALEDGERGDRGLMPPTAHTLRWLAQHAHSGQVGTEAARQAELRPIHPVLDKTVDGPAVTVPDHAPGGTATLRLPRGEKK